MTDPQAETSRLDRRAFIALGLGATAAGLAAACTPAATAPTAVATTAAKTTAAATAAASPTVAAAAKLASSIIYGAQSINDSVDPHGTLSNSGYQAITQTYDALLTFDDKGEKVIGALAADYRMVDATTMELRLKDNVRFSNGEPFTGEVVKWNFERVITSTDPLHLARKQSFTGYQVEVVNSTTVRIKVPTPDAILPNRLTGFFMAEPKFVTTNQGLIRDKAVGTGPLKVAAFRTQRDIEYEAWDGSWRGKSTVEKARIVAIPEAAALVAALQTGEIDIAFSPPPDQFASLKQSFTTATNPAGSCTVGVIIGGGTFPAAASSRIRQAMNHAIDKQQILDAVFGGLGRVATGQLGQPGVPGYVETLRAYPYDPERARQLIRESGIAAADLQMNIACVVSTRTFAEALAGYWSAVGLRSSITIQEFPAFVISLTQKSDMPVLTSRTDYFTTRDLDSAYFQFMNRPNVQDRFTNAEFNRLFPLQRSEVDPARRATTLRQMTEIFNQDAACAMTVWQDFPYAATKKIASIPINWDTAVPLWKVQKLA